MRLGVLALLAAFAVAGCGSGGHAGYPTAVEQRLMNECTQAQVQIAVTQGHLIAPSQTAAAAAGWVRSCRCIVAQLQRQGTPASRVDVQALARAARTCR